MLEKYLWQWGKTGFFHRYLDIALARWVSINCSSIGIGMIFKQLSQRRSCAQLACGYDKLRITIAPIFQRVADDRGKAVGCLVQNATRGPGKKLWAFMASFKISGSLRSSAAEILLNPFPHRHLAQPRL